jgi:Novel STAND NTPase 1
MGVQEVISSGVTGPTTLSTDNPWPGLLAFREADQGYFQGRKAETDELLRLVMRERLTVLFGLSGLGKSSLLQAGLFPMLRRETLFPVYIRLDFSIPEPDLVGEVKADVASEALAAQIEAPPAKPDETLWEYFHRQDNDFWNSRNRLVMPLLVFDQFEETFTLGCVDSKHCRATDVLIEQLADLAEGRPPAKLKARLDEHPDEARAFSFSRHHYKILLSIREDFLPELEALRARMPALALNRFRLRRMNGEAAMLVVNQAQHLIDSDVAEQVVRFVAADKRRLPLAELEVEPALLSVVCRELNNRRRKLSEPKITASLLEGSHEQVLTDLYEQSVADLPIEVRCFIEDHLLTVSGYRDSVAVDNALREPGVTLQSIDRLVERRLVRREDRGGVQRLELTHDLLTGVVRASRDRRLQLEAAEKERRALEEAREREKRQRDLRDLKRTRIAAVLFLILTVVAVGAAAWAINSRMAEKNARRSAEDARRSAEAARLEAENAKQEAEQQVKKTQTALNELQRSQAALSGQSQNAGLQAEQKRTAMTVDLIQRSLLIRQAALSGNKESLSKLLSSLDQNTSIRFVAKANDLGYKNPSNQQVYKFELYPEPATLPTGKEAVVFITYIANHPSFQNKLMTAGAEQNFRATYIGWGCLRRIVAVVEYKDPTKPTTVAEFDMCELLGW